MSPEKAKELLQKALSFIHADEAEIEFFYKTSGNLRFACNIPTTTGKSSGFQITITCAFKKRVGSFTTTEIDDEALQKAAQKAMELARFAPENEEHMSLLGPQIYQPSNEFDPNTATLSAEERAEVAALSIELANEKELHVAGYYESKEGFQAYLNSKGQFRYHPSTDANFTLTVRTPQNEGSGWAAGESFQAPSLNTRYLTERAIDKALRSQSPQAIDPGVYTVILEPAATAAMLEIFYANLDRRSADEGRSFFSDYPEGTKIGQKLFGENITIYSDHTDPLLPSLPWGEDGLPLEKVTWVEKGLLRNLSCSRYWAERKKTSPLPSGSNVIMLGDRYALDDLIASTAYGVLVTSFWYIRAVDPQTMLYTGLTRDGTFLIEKGKITRPVNNFRWNESPAAIFKCIEMMTEPERGITREGPLPILAPALKVKGFHFTSVSSST